MTTPQTQTRHADVADLVSLLRDQQGRKLDVVVPAKLIKADFGDIVLAGTEAQLTEDGVMTVDGRYRPTAIFDSSIASKLDIPPGYLSRCRAQNVGLYDENVNGWLRETPDKPYLVRAFRGDGGTGVARTFLSDSYKPIENLDVLMAVIEGIRKAQGEGGAEGTKITDCALTDRRMYVRVHSEAIAVAAPEIVKNYRSPYGDRLGRDYPMVFAGFEATNSEVGQGAFSITPRIVFQVCTNGQTYKLDAMRTQHLGAKLEPGLVRWSDETNQRNLELIRSQTADAVRTFLDTGYVTRKIQEMQALTGVPVTKPEEMIKQVVTKLRYTEAQQDEILAMFIKGGDLTAGGVMQAVTAAAQNQTDADLASEMEGDAFRALEFAAVSLGS